MEALRLIIAFASKKTLVAEITRFTQPDPRQRYSRLPGEPVDNGVQGASGAVLAGYGCG
jgi:hypothetical protein